jgi:hypothetical protein
VALFGLDCIKCHAAAVTSGYTAWTGGINILPSVKVAIIGLGSGSVTSDTGGINCINSSQGVCNEYYPSNSVVTLSAFTAQGSSFTGWTGNCNGFAPCVLAMTNNMSVTANFSLGPNNNGPMAMVGQTGFDSIANAYSAASSGASILAVTGTHIIGSLLLDLGKDVDLYGGYDSIFNSVGAPSVLQGTLEVGNGSLRVSNVQLK